MKVESVFSRRCITLTSILFACSTAIAVSRADATEKEFLLAVDAENVLRETAKSQSANLGKIETWSGHARIKTGQTKPPGSLVISELIFFWSGKNKARWKWEDVAELNVATGEETILLRPIVYRGMILDESYYVNSDETNLGLQQRYLNITRLDSSVARGSRYFSADWGFHWGEQVLSDRLMALAEQIKNNPILKVYKDGDRVFVEQIHKNGVNAYEFDLAKSGNCLKMFRKDAPSENNPLGLPAETWTNEWVFQDNVWLPHRVSYERVQQLRKRSFINGNVKIELVPDKSETLIKDVEYLDHTINQPINDENYSIDSMGLKSGDIINNRVKDVIYKY